MVAASNRIPSDLLREDLLENYFGRASLSVLASSALRTRSAAMRDIFVRGALHTYESSDELKTRVVFGNGLRKEEIKDSAALAELGRVVLLQDIFERDDIYGEKLLIFANEIENKGRLTMRNRRVLVQRHIVRGNFADAACLLDESPDVAEQAFGYLRAELINPFITGDNAFFDEWLDAFNVPFARHGLAPVELSTNEKLLPFDRLRAQAGSMVLASDGSRPLVSVVLTVFEPDENRLFTSVNSILTQTWTNFELIIVDDCSGPRYRAVFDHLAGLDDRISVIHAEENRGTYIARNIGYAASSGEYITGQDDDDWSHPERLERQVLFMEDNQNAIGCRVGAIRCDENLGKVRVGYLPHGQNASSLFIRREGYHAAGGFLPARKAADSEYHYRLEKVCGRPVATLPEPLSIIRILQNSLSRGDFGPGWKHSSRRSFRSSYEYWHASSASEDLKVFGELSSGVEIPRRFRIERSAEILPKYDVVFAADWESSNIEHIWMLDEILALLKADYRVAIMNLESPIHLREPIQKSLNDQIQHLINEGTVDEVFYEDPSIIRLLILREPPVLQFLSNGRSSLEVMSMVIVANEMPTGPRGSSSNYRVQDCHTNAVAAFGVSPIWVPKNPEIRNYLEQHLSAPTIGADNMPRTIDVDDRWQRRLWYRSIIPVVGYCSTGDMKNATDDEHMQALYPTDGSFDVRIRHDVPTPRKMRSESYRPSAWVIYQSDELTPTEFIHSLDYFACCQSTEHSEERTRLILEALVAGTVTILSTEFKGVFGEAAIYTQPEGFQELIHEFHADFSIYEDQMKLSKAILDAHFSYQAYVHFIQSLLTDQRV